MPKILFMPIECGPVWPHWLPSSQNRLPGEVVWLPHISFGYWLLLWLFLTFLLATWRALSLLIFTHFSLCFRCSYQVFAAFTSFFWLFLPISYCFYQFFFCHSSFHHWSICLTGFLFKFSSPHLAV